MFMFMCVLRSRLTNRTLHHLVWQARESNAQGKMLHELKKRQVYVSPPIDPTGPSSLFLAEAYAMGDEEGPMGEFSLGQSFL